MGKIFTYFLISFFCVNVQAKVLVLEYIGSDNVESHGDSVESIACRFNSENCLTYFTHHFNSESLSLLIEKPSQHFTTVNMSFGWEKPEFDYTLSMKLSTKKYSENKELHDQAISDFKSGIPLLKEIMSLNPDTLFVAASGNGVTISVIQTQGVAIDEKTQLFPSALMAPNLIKVSAINLPSIDPESISDYSLASYANFSLELTEVAAPVEPDFTGEVINGTSFSAPLISRLADEIKTINPLLKPIEIKEILMKSCHVKNIDKAINASLDLQKNGNKSDTYQAMFNRKRSVREKLQDKIGNIILVKCGGVVLQEVAHSCAQNTILNKNTITDSCINAQKEIRNLSDADISKILSLWEIRKI